MVRPLPENSSRTAARKAQAGAVVGPTQVFFQFAAAEARENGVQVVWFLAFTGEEISKAIAVGRWMC